MCVSDVQTKRSCSLRTHSHVSELFAYDVITMLWLASDATQCEQLQTRKETHADRFRWHRHRAVDCLRACQSPVRIVHTHAHTHTHMYTHKHANNCLRFRDSRSSSVRRKRRGTFVSCLVTLVVCCTGRPFVWRISTCCPTSPLVGCDNWKCKMPFTHTKCPTGLRINKCSTYMYIVTVQFNMLRLCVSFVCACVYVYACLHWACVFRNKSRRIVCTRRQVPCIKCERVWVFVCT